MFTDNIKKIKLKNCIIKYIDGEMTNKTLRSAIFKSHTCDKLLICDKELSKCLECDEYNPETIRLPNSEFEIPLAWTIDDYVLDRLVEEYKASNKKEEELNTMVNLAKTNRKENMEWSEVLSEMINNKAQAKLPSWGGYWAWEESPLQIGKDTTQSANNMSIMMHLKEGGVMDIRETERSEYTFGHMGRRDWICVYPGDKDYDKIIIPEFGYKTAERYLARGIMITRKSWEGKYYAKLMDNVECNIETNTIANGKKLKLVETETGVALDWIIGTLDTLAKDYTFFN